jgi:adenosylcobinamide amidohydrolase
MLRWEDIVNAEDTSERREYGRMCSGITVFRQGRALVVLMPNERFRTLSSGFTNGGFMDSPQAVINVTSMGGKVEYDCMRAGLKSYDEMNNVYAGRLGLDPERTVHLGTAANMDNAAVINKVSSDGVKVSIAITGGIRHNGGRSGDPTTYDESAARYREDPGTIISIMSIDADLSDSAMFQAMLMVTESKSCVIQELQARSLYSVGIATGSGTDQVAIISNRNSDNKIDTIARDSGLARAIAECAKEGLRETFDRQSGMTPKDQWDPLVLMSRYNMNAIRDEIRFGATMDELLSALEVIRKDSYSTAVVSAVLNVADDVRNGLITEEEGVRAAKAFVEDLALDEVIDPVERLRLDSNDTVIDLLSYACALKLIQTVRKRRAEDGQ